MGLCVRPIGTIDYRQGGPAGPERNVDLTLWAGR